MLLLTTLLAAAELPYTPVFRSGEGGYPCIRVPSVLLANETTLVAFAEARTWQGDGCHPTSFPPAPPAIKPPRGAGFAWCIGVDIAMKTSRDSGKSWSPMRIILKESCQPTAVWDWRARRLLLAFNSAFSNASVPFGGNHQVISDDLGRTWTAPRAIYPQLGKVVEETGPGLGLQLSPQAAKPGRILFIGSNFITEHVGHVWYSDDGGDTYTLAETDWEDTNEAQMAELPDGRVMANLRLQGFPKGRWPCACRAVATSTDSGSTWGPLSYDTHLPAPQCYATLLRLEQSLFFANPSNATQRNGGMIRRSDDWGECAQQHWLGMRLLFAAACATSLSQALLGQGAAGRGRCA